jgi:hypothetical protein
VQLKQHEDLDDLSEIDRSKKVASATMRPSSRAMSQAKTVAGISINSDQQGETSAAILAKRRWSGELESRRRAGTWLTFIGLFAVHRTRAEDV